MNLNDPRNIAEYVINAIIKYQKYRDDEIKSLQDTLEKFDIVKCLKCKKYTNNLETCEMCDYKCCQECSDIKHYATWNLSGMDMCEKCSLLYCHSCLAIKDCKSNLCNHCQDNF